MIQPQCNSAHPRLSPERERERIESIRTMIQPQCNSGHPCNATCVVVCEEAEAQSQFCFCPSSRQCQQQSLMRGQCRISGFAWSFSPEGPKTFLTKHGHGDWGRPVLPFVSIFTVCSFLVWFNSSPARSLDSESKPFCVCGWGDVNRSVSSHA